MPEIVNVVFAIVETWYDILHDKNTATKGYRLFRWDR